MINISDYVHQNTLTPPQAQHRNAAESHERASKHHYEAARLHEKGDHHRASIHANIAQSHAVAGLEKGASAIMN
jgi:hypothetical protein